MTNTASQQTDFVLLAGQIKQWARELGFQDVGITGIDLSEHEVYLKKWLANGFHGEMSYLADHGNKRSRPDELVPGTISIISVRMDYLPGDTQAVKVLQNSSQAYISRYALGRDYHKVIRKRLAKLANKITDAVGSFGYRAFVDSAPVLEKAIAENAGLGWIGKNTLVLNSKAGSWFFLGELYTNLPLPSDPPQATKHCGSCQACLDICPTDAFVSPYQLDARKCISYLTIELKGAIPKALRSKIGNRVFGCDDCQLVCPWNKFAKPTQETDFLPRHKLDCSELITLFLWTEKQFLTYTEGSPIRRTGYAGWLRNLAVGLGNAPSTAKVIAALKSRLDFPNEMVQEHISWALEQHAAKEEER
ncbi:tRNA epoxyqueuosine(34) reductase QueG [Zooshikella sp. RANM57]|uniref:tRNA epoxyqueuosine(34) reductase QueG n=1 Tax=Zooshikella sp. RANM57 TaxID=3425863 RepID=UPI003D6E8B11